ncbi:MAG: lytic murein transglycosylase [Myxococcaceae bacterium]
MLLQVALPLALGSALLGASPQTKTPAFEDFLKEVRKEAAAKGLSDATLQALDGLTVIEKVIEQDRRQPSSTMTFERYLQIILTEERISEGRRLLAEHRAELEEITKRYGVPPEIIVALWGIESKFGNIMGDHPVLGALATLAWEGRRASFFRKELFNALTILEQGHIDAASMKGSWAGAMGQCQFMPSTFLRHSADGDGDGKRDIWGSKPDVFASAANYLAKIGWDKGSRWGREVKLPEKFDPAHAGMKNKKPKSLAAWRKLGVTLASGEPLPDDGQKAWLLRPDGKTGPAVLAYPNVRVILDWNRSQYFAAGVGLLADRISAP